MRITKAVSVRHPKSFDRVLLSISAHRDVFMTRGNGGEPITELVTSKVITPVYFRTAIEVKYDECLNFEHFVDHVDGREIIRGMVVHEGVQKCFYVRFDELTESHLDDVLKSLELTKRLEEL